MTFAKKTMRLSTGARLVGHLASEPCAERSHCLVWEPVTGVDTELDRLATTQRERPGLNDICAVGGHTLGVWYSTSPLCGWLTSHIPLSARVAEA